MQHNKCVISISQSSPFQSQKTHAKRFELQSHKSKIVFCCFSLFAFHFSCHLSFDLYKTAFSAFFPLDISQLKSKHWCYQKFALFYLICCCYGCWLFMWLYAAIFVIVAGVVVAVIVVVVAVIVAVVLCIVLGAFLLVHEGHLLRSCFTF